MTGHRWERERAAVLMQRSRPGTSSRRRAEILVRDARRGQRAGAGMGDSVVTDDVSPAWWRRRAAKEGGSAAGTVALALVGTAAAVVAGPGVLAGYGGYRALERYAAPRVGRLWVWPHLAAAGALALVLRLTGVPLGISFQLDRRFPVSLIELGPWWGWAAWQVVWALAATAYWIWAWGWAGVPAGAVAAPAKNRDGSWKATPEHKKVQLGTVAPTQTARPVHTRPRRPGAMGRVLDAVEALGDGMLAGWRRVTRWRR